MGQLNVRADDELLAEVKRRAERAGTSTNRWVVRLLAAAVNPDLADDETERLRERLARAGLLEEPEAPAGMRPDDGRIADAGRRAAVGTPISDLISEQRR